MQQSKLFAKRYAPLAVCTALASVFVITYRSSVTHSSFGPGLRKSCSEAMADAAETAGEPYMFPLFACKCPVGNCPKKNTYLGVKGVWYTERRARQAVFDHLAGTPAHSALSLENCAVEAEACDVKVWEVSELDPGVVDDLEKNNCTLSELQEWQDQAAIYDDPEQRGRTKRHLPEPSAAPRKRQKKDRHQDRGRSPSPRDRSRGRKRRSASPRDRERDRRAPTSRAVVSARASGSGRNTEVSRTDRTQLAALGDRLDDQIQEQTRNAYIFVQVVFSMIRSWGCPKMNRTTSRASPNDFYIG